MIPVPSGVRVWIATGHTDMRKGMPGLALLVQEHLKREPHAGDLFVFRGRAGALIKIIWHEGLGMSLYAKRLDRGRFVWPKAQDGAVALTSAQLGYMLEGIDWVRRETGRRQKVKVLCDEGVANHIDPESCAVGREVIREALTGVRVGQPLSGEILPNRSVDAHQSAEDNMSRRAIASTGRLRAVVRPWHARTSFAREPRDLRTALASRAQGRTGKAGGRSL
jgi:transposase